MNYILSQSAEADLRDIIDYTRAQWGHAQAQRYIAQLGQGMTRLAARREPFRDMSFVYPMLRMARCGHHYIFCVPRDGAPAWVMAIFHERMDFMARLAQRLKEETP